MTDAEKKTVAAIREVFGVLLDVSREIPSSKGAILHAFDWAVAIALDPEEWKRSHPETAER